MNKEKVSEFNYNFGNFVQEGEMFGFGSSLVENQKLDLQNKLKKKLDKVVEMLLMKYLVSQIGIQLSKSYNGTENNMFFDVVLLDSVLNDLTRIE